MFDPVRSPEVAAARLRFTAALQEAGAAFEALLELVDPRETHHDDVAELLMAHAALAELHRTTDPETKNAVLAWLLDNVGGIRAVTVGELKYWGEKDKTTKCIDVGVAFATLAHIRLENRLLEVAAGEEGAQSRFWGGLRDVAREVVSSNGLKEGACRQALGDEAEEELRAEVRLNPGAVGALEGEAPEQALERAISVAREASFLQHFVEEWPDKLMGGAPQTKLGVANLRFVHRRGGGTKKELEEMERKRLAAGDAL